MLLTPLRSKINPEIIDWYVSRGLKLIRISSTEPDPYKRPLDKWTSNDITYQQIIKHAKQGKNLGWHIGESHLVIDVDPRNGGSESLSKLEDMLGYNIITNYPTVCTGGGGYHFYTALPADCPPLRTKLSDYPGIEFLTGNKQVIIPGSIHPKGKLYELPKNFKGKQVAWPGVIPTIPLEIVKLIERQSPHTHKAPSSHVSPSQLKDVLETIDPPQDYDEWIAQVGAIHNATGGSADGLELAIEWSEQDPLYEGEAREAIERRWSSFDKPHDHPRTIKSILHAAPPSAAKTHLRAELTAQDFIDEIDDNHSDNDDLIEFREHIDAIKPGDKSSLVHAVKRIVTEFPFDETELKKRLRKSLGIPRDDFGPMFTKLKKGFKKDLPKPSKPANPGGRPPHPIPEIVEHALSNAYNDGKHLIHATNQQYYYYNKTHWVPGLQNAIDQRLTYSAQAVNETREKPFEITSAVTRAEKLLRSTVTTHHDLLRFTAPPPSVINTRNFELHIDPKTGECTPKPHSYDSYLTQCVDVEFDPLADCPSFTEMLHQVFAHMGDETEDTVRHFWEIVGYIIQPYKNIPLICLWHGHGFNGKTTIASFIAKLIGERAVLSTKLQEFSGTTNNHALASLEGKLLLLDDDLQANMVLSDGLVKKLSETKAIEVNPKNKPAYTLTATVTPLLLGNNLPMIRDTSRGMQRRFDLLPFTTDISPHAKSKLPERAARYEMSGILNEALTGLQRLRKRGSFDPPSRCIKDRERFFAQSNSVLAWISYRCELNAKASANDDDLFESYKLYCAFTGDRPERYTRWRKMLEQFGEPVSVDGRTIRGIDAD